MTVADLVGPDMRARYRDTHGSHGERMGTKAKFRLKGKDRDSYLDLRAVAAFGRHQVGRTS